MGRGRDAEVRTLDMYNQKYCHRYAAMDNPIDPRIFSGHHLKKRMSWQWQDDQQRCMEARWEKDRSRCSRDKK